MRPKLARLDLLKKYYNLLPYSIRGLAQSIPFGVFLGRDYRRHLKFLRNFENSSIEVQTAYSTDMLFSYLNDAIVDTPFYRDFAKSKGWQSVTSFDQFLALPIITKEHLLEDLSWFTPDISVSRFKVSTGGTTGRQTELYMSNQAYRLEWAFKAMLLEREGVDIDSKRICLRGIDFTGSEAGIRFNPLYKELQISPFQLNHNTIAETLDIVERFKPQWVHGYPSSVAEFARLCKASDRAMPSFHAALLVSEKLDSGQVSIIKNEFGAKILSFYGMTERVIFAPMSQDGVFHPHLAYGFTEEVDNQLVGTGYINNATRLIRYSTGDEAIVTKRGRLVVAIDSIVGRWGKEYLLGNNDTRITMTALNTHSSELSFIRRYQFYQRKAGSCVLSVVLADGYNPSASQLESAKNVFQRKVGDELDITLQVVSDIPLTTRGKHQFIVSEVA